VQVRRIVSVNPREVGGTEIGLDAPLEHSHFAGVETAGAWSVDMRAKVPSETPCRRDCGFGC
jgi:hypothetical protein